MKIKVKKFTVVFSIILAGLAHADISKQIDNIIGQPSQKGVEFSVHIIKAASGETVYSRNANKALMPASNMKIITTAAALKYLGPNYEYKTQVGLCGDSLMIIGSGDPLLGDKVTDAKYSRKNGWIFEDIAASLTKKNMKAIDDIIVDTGIFDNEYVHPNWPKEQLNREYACEISGLNFNGNCVDITAKNIDGKVSISIDPPNSLIKFTNNVKPIRKGKGAVGAYRQTGKPNDLIIKGKCKGQQGPFAVAIEKPALFFSSLLVENLSKAGIKVNGQVLENPPSRNCKFKPLAKYNTPITDCLARCNKDSFGLAAEALLKTIAANSQSDSRNGSWTKGRETISQYLLNLGIGKEEFYIDDGSGLSKQNKLSANTITKVLSDIYKDKNWELYRNSLAVGGKDGTIGRYFKEEKYRGKLFGKTGYIDGVKTFSGVCTSSKGDYIFSILTNNATGQTREAINDIAKAIIDSE